MTAHTMTSNWTDCIAACVSCMEICNKCSDDMIGMDSHGDGTLMADCTRMCRDCADICAMAAQWMSRHSAAADMICHLCADVCTQCAELCEKHASHHALCGPCAKECRRCADMCRQMSASGK